MIGSGSKLGFPLAAAAVITMFLGPGFLDARAQGADPREPGKLREKQWANIEGFRSAHFGMSEPEVLKAIFRDFKIPKSKVIRKTHPIERTVRLGIKVSGLLPSSGPAHILYILGFKSNKLIEIDLIWGNTVSSDMSAERVVGIANQLLNHFSRQKFQKDGLVINGTLPDGSILVFRGKDRKGRMAILHYNNPKDEDGKPSKEKTALRLSYIETPTSPDIFQIKEGEF
ncbi:MAG: hypothetical protein ACE5E9_11170 [Nitrospinaceae bacterium]